jgi:hypothetical protein
VVTFGQVAAVLSRCKFKDWGFLLLTKGDGFLVQLEFLANDNFTGELRRHKGRKWYVSAHSTKDEIVRTAFLAVKTAREHETREQFKFDGYAIYGPHQDVDDLTFVKAEKPRT